MGFDDNDFENQLEKELENYMGRPLTDIGTNGSGEPEDEGDDFPEGGKKAEESQNCRNFSACSSACGFDRRICRIYLLLQ